MACPHLARGNGLFGALPLWGPPVLYARADSPAQAGKLAVTAAGRATITGRAAGPQRLVSSSATATALPFEHVASRSWWSGMQPLPRARRPLHMLGASLACGRAGLGLTHTLIGMFREANKQHEAELKASKRARG